MAGEVGTVASLVGDAFLNIASAPESMLNAARGKVGALVGPAQVLLALATLAEATTIAYAWFLSGSVEKMLSGFFRLAIMVAVPLAALGTVGGSSNWGAASAVIPSYFQGEIASAVSGGTEPLTVITKLTGLVDKFGRQMLEQIIDKKPPAPPPPAPDKPAPAVAPEVLIGAGEFGALSSVGTASTGGTFGNVVRSVGNVTLLAIPNLIEKTNKVLIVIVAYALFLVLVTIPAIILSFVLLANLFGAQILAYVGAIFGPLMIAFLPWQPMSWLFMNWVRYMIITGVSYAIALLLASIAAEGTSTMVDKFIAALDVGGGQVIDFAGILVFYLPMFFATGATLLFMAWLVHKCEDIASALIGGGGAGGGGFIAIASRTLQQIKAPKGPNNKAAPQSGGSGGGSGGASAAPTTGAPSPGYNDARAAGRVAGAVGSAVSNAAAAVGSTASYVKSGGKE